MMHYKEPPNTLWSCVCVLGFKKGPGENKPGCNKRKGLSFRVAQDTHEELHPPSIQKQYGERYAGVELNKDGYEVNSDFIQECKLPEE